MYHNIAPDIFRKRLIIEGKYNAKITSLDFLYNFLLEFTKQIEDSDKIIKGLRGPFVFDPAPCREMPCACAQGCRGFLATGYNALWSRCWVYYMFDKKVTSNSSYDGFIVWNENEVSTYIWHNTNFFTVDIYTCSDFNTNAIVDFVSKKFACMEFTWHELPQPAPFPENTSVEIRKLDGVLGSGVFATKFIPKETYLTYIDGEVIYGEKESDVAKTHKTAGDHVMQFQKHFFRNAFNMLAVTINHSCEPNCYVKNLFCMYSMRDIEKGEQLTQSYSLICNSDWKVPGGKCYCGSKNCLESILPWRDLPRKHKLKYLPYTSDWILFEEMKKNGFVDKLKELF